MDEEKKHESQRETSEKRETSVRTPSGTEVKTEVTEKKKETDAPHGVDELGNVVGSDPVRKAKPIAKEDLPKA